MCAIQSSLGKQAERVERCLREAITAGELAPGSRLATERELCRQFDVSRTTVRAAIHCLVADGYVTVRHGAGMYVRTIKPSALPGSQTISVMLSCSPLELALVQQQISALGYLTCIYFRDSRWDPSVERQFLQRVQNERHKGLLAYCTPSAPTNDDLLRAMEDDGIRVMHIENYRLEPPEQNYLLPDYRKAGYMAAVAQIYAKYTHFYFVNGPNEWPDSVLLRQGYFEAIADFTGKVLDEQHLITLPNGVDDCPERIAQVDTIIRSLPPSSAILCNNMSLADVLLRFLRKGGRQCPEDIGLIGIPYIDWPGTAPNHEIDTLEFDRAHILIKAVEYIHRPSWTKIQEYVAPTIQHRGTVRAH